MATDDPKEKADRDNRSDQLNPNNDKYWDSRKGNINNFDNDVDDHGSNNTDHFDNFEEGYISDWDY